MIFWEKLKIQNNADSASIQLTEDGQRIHFDKPIEGTIQFNSSITIPSGSSFDGPVTLLDGSSFDGPVTLPTGSSVASALTYVNDNYNLDVANITVDSIHADVANLDTANITNLTVAQPVQLPAGSSINGTVIRPGPVQDNSLFIDGHFGDYQDWLSITNYSTTSIYTQTQLFTKVGDKPYGKEYLLKGSPVKHYDFITPGKTVKVLEFYDVSTDPAKECYVRIQYRVSENKEWQDINGNPFQGKDVTGVDKQIYRTYGTPSETADWFRTLLYADDNEYWFIFSLPYISNTSGGLNAFVNMAQNMYNQGYRFISTHRYPTAWLKIAQPLTENDISSYYCVGGAIGFAKRLKNN